MFLHGVLFFLRTSFCIYSYGRWNPMHFITKTLVQLLSSGPEPFVISKADLRWPLVQQNVKKLLTSEHPFFFALNSLISLNCKNLLLVCRCLSSPRISICPILCGQFISCLSLIVINACWVQSLHKHGLRPFGKIYFVLFFFFVFFFYELWRIRGPYRWFCT